MDYFDIARKRKKKTADKYINKITENVLIIPLKNNMTRGDIIKKVFPDVEIFEENSNEVIWGRSKTETNWWNTLYQKKDSGK